METLPDKNEHRWHALFRGSVLSATINKHVSYVGFADRRAQNLIIINAVLIPLALNGFQQTSFYPSAWIAIIAAVFSIAAAIISSYPKRYRPKNEHGHNLLHFSQIKDFSESEYLKRMQGLFQNNEKLAEMLTRDLYHLSAFILTPKFFWLKISYAIFFIGNILALLTFIVSI